jgi:hypothetical protein
MKTIFIGGLGCAVMLCPVRYLGAAPDETQQTSPPPPSETQEKPSLEQVRSQMKSADFEKGIELGLSLLKDVNLSRADRVELLFLLGRAYISVSYLTAAENMIRDLLQLEPTFNPPEFESPAIVAVIRKVQADEKAAADARWEKELRTLQASIEVGGGPPDKPVGGLSLPFVYTLKDPLRAVKRFELSYRKDPTAPFSRLPLRYGGMEYRAEIPADWTQSEGGVKVDYFATTYHANGARLITLGTKESPMKVNLAPGLLDDHLDIYASPWFWAISGSVGVGVLAAAGLLLDMFLLPRGTVGQLNERPTSHNAWLWTGVSMGVVALTSVTGVVMTW